MFTETVGCESAFGAEAGLAAGDHIENRRARDAADDLGDDVGNHLRFRMPSADDQPDGDRRIEVAAGDVADGVGHGQHREAEGERDTDEADAQADGGLADPRYETRREDRAAAAAEDEPEGAEELGGQFVSHGGCLTRDFG